MLFNSVQFIFFFLSVFLIYWFLLQKYLKLQNLLILIASYLFYAMWDWRFLLLIAFSSGVSYISGYFIEKYRFSDKSTFNVSKMLVTANVILNLLILIFFKYCNFFSLSLVKLFRLWGYELDWVTLDILLPIGISFYTFQAVGYAVDVYKQKTKPEKDVISFFAYISFFPKLTAGPIEKSTHLLPQFSKPRHFEYNDMVSGTRQLLWGLFKKLVVADNCGLIVNSIFDNSSDATGATLILGAIMFTFQIYGDFSGYSDMAIGLSRLLGFNLVDNFKFPYFSRDVSEFWARWHISLNTWFRDYVYIPLGGV